MRMPLMLVAMVLVTLCLLSRSVCAAHLLQCMLTSGMNLYYSQSRTQTNKTKHNHQTMDWNESFIFAESANQNQMRLVLLYDFRINTYAIMITHPLS
jgi:hypothetical protein